MNLLEAVCREAARAANAAVAWVGVLDETGERVLAATGSKSTHLPAQSSFAAAMAGGVDVLVIADASADSRFASNPLVSGPAEIRMYAGVPLLAEDGVVLGALSVADRHAHDLGEREIDLLRLLGRVAARELELTEELHESEERFRDFFDLATDHIFSVAPNGVVLHANDMAMTTFGLERGMPLSGAVDPERREEFVALLAHVFGSGQAERVEMPFRTASGEAVTLEGWLRPRLFEGRAALVRVVFRDVTDRKQFETELGNARDAALESARVKNHFLSNVSHEIRTPMNGIVGMIDLMLASRLDAEQRDYAHQARASAEHLLSVVNNILYISNLEAGGLGSAKSDFDPRRMIQRIIDVEKIAALGKELDVRARIDERIPMILRGNQSKVRQVITNLLDNAVKFTEKGLVTLTVSPQTETATHRVVRFEVRDTGIGISEEDRLRLFERFAQLDDAATRRFHGVGLGLATARHLVETLGGLIDVESEPGKGSTFWFSVPFPKTSGDGHPIATSEFELKGVRVLLLDHLLTSRKLVRHYLEMTWEMRVEIAEDSAGALAALHQARGKDPFRIVIFDSVPSDLDPLWFARTVRLDPEIASTRLLYLVTTPRSVNEEKAREAGINAWAQRPVGQRELLDALVIAMAPDAAAAAPKKQTLPLTAPPPAAPAPGGVSIRDLRVLLAEDNFLNMKLTMTQLQKLGCPADVAANGKELLDLVAQKQYDVILMDCQMPILDGYEATIQLRRQEAEGRQHRHWIIAMTANALEGDREKCLAAGMDDYLSKPTHHHELTRALTRAASMVHPV